MGEAMTHDEYGLFEDFERLLRAGRFEDVDALFRRVPARELSVSAVLAILTITSYARSSVFDRDAWRDAAVPYLEEELGAERAARLLEARR